ncbi:MAG: 1-acyl-sn-glycerol-3-phosphate acyltransferase [Clostridia bacterium]|nr:1-acyl-sn-glycerol-3-phosphate acyltransferase [Clostridia bacterium]
MEKSQERLKILKRIDEYEKLGKFNDDVEDDDPAKPFSPKDVDYTCKKLSSKIKTYLANTLGTMYFESMIKKHKFIIKDVLGIENAMAVKGGAIVTCNHFNIKDNYAVYRSLKPILKRRKLYKVIKDSNYTNFKGVVRLIMRHANTLPLSSSYDVMKSFYRGVQTLLGRGEKILIYPEQAMWFNYKKPRPFKDGAFKIATIYNVPVLPMFITMKDSDILDDDGFLVQEYYVHILPAIYPEKDLNITENTQRMKQKNYDEWVSVYEKFYGIKLEYGNL